MSPQIIFVNPTAKPKLPAPAPITEAPDPEVKRISWGISSRLQMPATAERSQLQQGDRPNGRARVVQSRSVVPEAPRVRMRYVERGSRLERLPGKRLLSEQLDRQIARPALEYLTILHSQSTQQYWIADAETGEVFVRQAFTTLEHCHEAAAELEHTFVIAQVLEMRSPETMERVGELMRGFWVRERVAVGLG